MSKYSNISHKKKSFSSSLDPNSKKYLKTNILPLLQEYQQEGIEMSNESDLPRTRTKMESTIGNFFKKSRQEKISNENGSMIKVWDSFEMTRNQRLRITQSKWEKKSLNSTLNKDLNKTIKEDDRKHTYLHFFKKNFKKIYQTDMTSLERNLEIERNQIISNLVLYQSLSKLVSWNTDKTSLFSSLSSLESHGLP